jgi:hypothetical protein
MKPQSRKGLIWLSLILLTGFAGMAATTLRVGMALEDPDLGLALEAFDKPSKLSYLRGKLYLRAGGNADKPITHWGVKDPPLVAAVDSGNHELARALVDASSRATWQAAVNRACVTGRDKNDAIIRVLAGERGMDPEKLCSLSAEEGARPASGE